jgi:3-oxoacyl-[acyl-carrier protein] reductase
VSSTTYAAAAAAPRFPDLAGKVALVTGGSKGIGAATVLALAANGARVAVNSRGEEGVEAMVRRVAEEGGEAIGVPGDAGRLSEIDRVRDRVERELGPIDVLIAFAGGFGKYTAVQDITEEEWHEIVDSNLTATFLCLKSVLPGMIERRRGAIVTMASNAARHLDGTLTASYAAAKAGVVQLTRHVALETGRHGIRVNCIAPATTTTERIDRIMTAERRAELAAKSPLGRLALPEECAAATLFLASEAAAGFITGLTLDVTGGRTMT